MTADGWHDFRLKRFPVASRLSLVTWPRTARAGVKRFVIVPCVRRAGGHLNILARTDAWIDESAGAEFLQRGKVGLLPLTLRVRPECPAAIGPFLPLKTEPTQVLEHGGDKVRFHALSIQIFVAQHQHAAPCLGPLLRCPESPCVAQVQVARRRRGEAAAIRCGAGCHVSGAGSGRIQIGSPG